MHMYRSHVATGAKLCCCNVEVYTQCGEHILGPNQVAINLLINRRRKGKGVNSPNTVRDRAGKVNNRLINTILMSLIECGCLVRWGCMIIIVYKGRHCVHSRPTCHVSVFRGQRQKNEQNSTHACLTGTIPNFITFDRMKDELVVNTITEFDRYWSGNSRVTADLLSDLTVLLLCVLSKRITEQN